MSKFDVFDLDTKSLSNKKKKVFPEGEKENPDFWLEIVGQGSDKFAEGERQAIQLMEDGKLERKDLSRYLISWVIVGWNSATKCTQEKAYEWLEKNPKYLIFLDTELVLHGNFTEARKSALSNTRKRGKSSKSQSK
jgi:hypothetical protein